MSASLDLSGIVTTANSSTAMGAVSRARTLLVRALKQDNAAVVRFRNIGEHSVDMFISTPLKCAVATRMPGRVADGEVFLADNVLQALESYAPGDSGLDFGATMNIRWPGALPPATGYDVIDTVPAGTFRQLHADMEQENAGTPTGIARSLLEQVMVNVTKEDGGEGVDITGRIIAAIGGLGIAAQPPAELQQYDQIRVSANASWVRLDSVLASIYTPRPGGLSRVP